MKIRVISISIAVFSLFLLSGCNQYKVQKRVNSLEAAITSYDVALRWAHYRDAYNYHVSPNGTQPPANLERLQEISVTGVRVVEKTINDEHTEATVKTEIDYFLKDRGTVKKLRLEQLWWVNQETSQWFIDGEFPNFF